MYVLPVAAWILRSGPDVVTVSAAMAGLGGRADRPRIIEALVKLTEIGAVSELPRAPQKNAPRMFSRVENPYWDFVSAFLAGLRMER
jgi:hypothetical protein